MDYFFQNVMLFSNIVHYEQNILVWNYSNTMNISSTLWILMAWLVLWHQGISSNSVEYTLKCFHLLNSSPPSAAYMSVNRVSTGSGNGLSPLQRQAITWTNASLSIGLLGTNFSEILIGILSFSFKKMHLKLSSAYMAFILPTGRWIKG